MTDSDDATYSSSINWKRLVQDYPAVTMMPAGGSWGDWYPSNELRWSDYAVPQPLGEPLTFSKLQQLWVRRHNLESRYEEEWRDVPHR